MRSLLLILCVATACAKTAPTANDPVSDTASNDAAGASVTIVEGSTPTEEQRNQMLAAKEALFEKLSGRLMEAMGEGGPAAAIAVCQTEAPLIAKTVGQQQGVSIGRTGVRLRNPNNEAPAWARDLVEAKIDKPTFVTLSDNKAAAMLPIKLQVQCLMCHGPGEQISPDVKEQLSKLYPNDEATGFQEGELRGWFWITLASAD